MDRAIKILFLAANPHDTNKLRLDEEMRDVDQALRQSEFRERFDVKQHWAVRIVDLQGYLLRHRPDIVHFSGHGSVSSEIILEDNNGNSKPVSTRALSQLFSVLKDNIRCVVLNACFSEQQAKAIAEHIECVIGMSKSIGDSAAISFAAAFYQAVGYGKDIKTAFDLGCLQIDLEGLNEQNTPKLLALSKNPQQIVLVNEHSTFNNQVGTLAENNINSLDSENSIDSQTKRKKALKFSYKVLVQFCAILILGIISILVYFESRNKNHTIDSFSNTISRNYEIPKVTNAFSVEFTRVMIESTNQYWKEIDPLNPGLFYSIALEEDSLGNLCNSHYTDNDWCKKCSQIFSQTKLLVKKVDPKFDITVMNKASNPILLLSVGVELVHAFSKYYTMGEWKSIQVMIEGEYRVEMPHEKRIRAKTIDGKTITLLSSVYHNLETRPDSLEWNYYEWADLPQLIATSIPNPVYMNSSTPYRFTLQLEKYYRLPNNVILRFYLKTSSGEIKSALMYLLSI